MREGTRLPQGRGNIVPKEKSSGHSVHHRTEPLHVSTLLPWDPRIHPAAETSSLAMGLEDVKYSYLVYTLFFHKNGIFWVEAQDFLKNHNFSLKKLLILNLFPHSKTS